MSRPWSSEALSMIWFPLCRRPKVLLLTPEYRYDPPVRWTADWGVMQVTIDIFNHSKFSKHKLQELMQQLYLVSCHLENGIAQPKVSHQPYADSNAKHSLSHFLFIFYWKFLARISASIFSTSSGASTPWASWSTLITYNYRKQTETKLSALGYKLQTVTGYAPYKKICYCTHSKHSSIQTVVHREQTAKQQ